MDINILVKITSRAWSLCILALLHNGTPGRQAPLLAASGASRTAFAQSLAHLIDLKLLERNPGHGHPLRPEYRLTPLGAEAAVIASEIGLDTVHQNQSMILRRAWSIPILAVSQKPIFFTEIKKKLTPVTDRALSQSLQQLQSNHLIMRDVDISSKPPRPLYHAVDEGLRIGRIALEL